MVDPTDRRATERFPVNVQTSCPFASPAAEDFGPVRVRDISMEGIGLILSRRIETGGLLALTLTNAAKGFTKSVIVRVTHATPVGSNCLVGGAFTVPLTYQELTLFVM
jgi:hypothetical protein